LPFNAIEISTKSSTFDFRMQYYFNRIFNWKFKFFNKQKKSIWLVRFLAMSKSCDAIAYEPSTAYAEDDLRGIVELYVLFSDPKLVFWKYQIASFFWLFGKLS
jgi:hypothetical protein